MTEIKPFAAVHYNPDKISDLSKVICPPYDVISPEQQTGYYNASEYNFIRVLLNKEKSTDDSSNNRYTRSKEIFEDWLTKQILVQDEKPGVYYYKQEFKIQGSKHSRLGFISLMKIQDDKDSKIHPHEKTHAAAKEDRLKLWKALNSNLSSIFVCFSDKTKKVENIFTSEVALQEPTIDVTDDNQVRHILWKLDDEKMVKEIVDSLKGQDLFIADGHHRYEVSKELRRIKMAKIAKPTGHEPFNYVMTYFTNMDNSRNLTIFPIHRVIKKFSEDLGFLEKYFRIDKIKSKSELQIMLSKAGLNEPSFGLYTRNERMLLRLKNKLLIDKVIKEGSKEYRRLDATILKHFVFENVGITADDLTYVSDYDRATGMVDSGEADICFVMNPVKIKQIRDVALNGERMPPKTTFFYPKILSGLTVYKMD